MVLLTPLSVACKKEYLQMKRTCRVSQTHLFHFLRHVDMERNFWDIRQQVESMFSNLEPARQMTSAKIVSQFTDILSLRVQTAACGTRRLNFKYACVPEAERDEGHEKAILLQNLIVELADNRLRELDRVMLQRQNANPPSDSNANMKPVSPPGIAPSSLNRKKKKSKGKGPNKEQNAKKKLKEEEEDAYLEAAFKARQQENVKQPEMDLWELLQNRQKQLQAAQEAEDKAYDQIVAKLLDFLERLHIIFQDPFIYNSLIQFIIIEHSNDLVAAANNEWPKRFVQHLLIEIKVHRQSEVLVPFDMSKAVQKVAFAVTIIYKDKVKGRMPPFDAEALTRNLLLMNSLPRHYEQYYNALLGGHPIEQIPSILVQDLVDDDDIQEDEESMGDMVYSLAVKVWFMYSAHPIAPKQNMIEQRAMLFETTGLDSESALTSSKFVVSAMHLIRTDAFPWDRVRDKIYMKALLSMPTPPDKQVLYADAPAGLERYCQELLG